MKEAEFQKRITAMAERFSWSWWHVPAPMRWTSKGWVAAREAAGLPDLILLHDDPPRMIIAEVKGDGGKLADPQIEFLRMAKAVADASFGPAELTGDGFSPEGAQGHFPRTVGVYVFTPDIEDAIEQMLRSKVLL